MDIASVKVESTLLVIAVLRYVSHRDASVQQTVVDTVWDASTAPQPVGFLSRCRGM